MSSISQISPFAAPSLFPAASSPTQTSSSNNSSSSSDSANQLTGDSFITLLTAQLQAQDPTNPLDPTTFVTELVQFNQLQQLIDINQTLSAATGAAPTSSSQSTLPNSAAISV